MQIIQKRKSKNMKALLFTIPLLIVTTLGARDLVYDQTTGLLWQDARDNEKLAITYKEASNYCANLVIEKYDNFRLPTLNELQTIVDYRNYKPAILKGFYNYDNEVYWTTTPSAKEDEDVWAIDFKKGGRVTVSKNYDRHVRCVLKRK